MIYDWYSAPSIKTEEKQQSNLLIHLSYVGN